MLAPLSRCDACGTIAGAVSCKAAYVLAPGNEHAPRIAYGMEQHLLVVNPGTGDLATTCPCCQTPRGGRHHAPCRLEECPNCAGNAWECRCILERLAIL